MNITIQCINLLFVYIGENRLLGTDEADGFSLIMLLHIVHHRVDHIQHLCFASHILAYELIGCRGGGVAGDQDQLAVLL
ncbi:hypothetical protein D3C86_2103260 [compost metagenome]